MCIFQSNSGAPEVISTTLGRRDVREERKDIRSERVGGGDEEVVWEMGGSGEVANPTRTKNYIFT